MWKGTQDLYWFNQCALHPVRVTRIIRTKFVVGRYKWSREWNDHKSLVKNRRKKERCVWEWEWEELRRASPCLLPYLLDECMPSPFIVKGRWFTEEGEREEKAMVCSPIPGGSPSRLESRFVEEVHCSWFTVIADGSPMQNRIRHMRGASGRNPLEATCSTLAAWLGRDPVSWS
jgi:hypothetical protein